MAYLTSLFRYRVLAEHGGIWADMDVVALDDDPQIEARPLIASEKRRPFRHAEPTATGESLTQVTNCFMANPEPRTGDLWHRAVDRVAALNPEERTLGKRRPAHALRPDAGGARRGHRHPAAAKRSIPSRGGTCPAISSRSAIRRHRPSCTCTQRSGRGAAWMPKRLPARSLAGRLWRRFGLSGRAERSSCRSRRIIRMPATTTMAAPIQVKESGKSPNSTRP